MGQSQRAASHDAVLNLARAAINSNIPAVTCFCCKLQVIVQVQRVLGDWDQTGAGVCEGVPGQLSQGGWSVCHQAGFCAAGPPIDAAVAELRGQGSVSHQSRACPQQLLLRSLQSPVCGRVEPADAVQVAMLRPTVDQAGKLQRQR